MKTLIAPKANKKAPHQSRLECTRAKNAARIGQAMITQAISIDFEHAAKSWISEERSKDCFCDLPELLAAFVDGGLSNEEIQRMSDHLMKCECCFFAAAELKAAIREPRKNNCSVRENTTPPDFFSDCYDNSLEPHWRKWFENCGFRRFGPTVFPDGLVGDRVWEFGRLIGHYKEESILDRLADACIKRIDPRGSEKNLVLVAFGDAMHRLSVHIAGQMKEMRGERLDIHVVGVKRYEEPCLLCKTKTIKQKSIVIVADVVHSGSLLEKLWHIVERHAASDVKAICMVNQYYDGPRSKKLIHLAREKKESRTRINTDEWNSIRSYDPVSGVSIPDWPKQETIGWSPDEISDWLPDINRTGAFRRGLRISKKCYPFAVNVLDLLRDKKCSAKILFQATEWLRSLDKNKRWIFVYPASRARRAGKIAKMLAAETGWDYVALGKFDEQNFLNMSPEARSKIYECDGAIIVDSAIRSGDTFRSQVELLQQSGVPEIHAFYVLDLRREHVRCTHQRFTKTIIKSLVSIPFGFPPESIKSLIKNRFIHLKDQIDESGFSDKAKSALHSFCETEFGNRRKGFTKPVLSQQILYELDKGTTPDEAIIEKVVTGSRQSINLTGFFDSRQTLNNDHQIRDAKFAINNSATPPLIKELALLLASQGDYSWFNKNWLLLHEELLTGPKVNWGFLAGIAVDARLKNPAVARIMGTAIRDFRDVLLRRKANGQTQFEFNTDESIFEQRCETLIEILGDGEIVDSNKEFDQQLSC